MYLNVLIKCTLLTNVSKVGEEEIKIRKIKLCIG